MKLPRPLRVLASVVLACTAAATARSDAAGADLQRRLVEDLASESASVREEAAVRLAAIEDLDGALLASMLGDGPSRARPLLLSIAVERKATAVLPAAAALAAGADAVAAEAAIRALVSFGDEGVAAARKALSATTPKATRDARLVHIDALEVQRRVERDVLSRWRRKGGSYRGRYATLAVHGWDAQPILLAMFLDVPLEDRFVVVPPSGDADVDRARRMTALAEIQASRRRGYRTFDPLPRNLDQDDLFDLAQQALTDVADLELCADVLEIVHDELMQAAMRAERSGVPLRRVEDALAMDVECILAARGRPEFLESRRRNVEAKLTQHRRWARADSDYQSLVVNSLNELGAVLHQLGKFVLAAEKFEEASELVRDLTGKTPSITSYNRACALARAGRKDDAIEALAASLDKNESSGSEDLTREWVTEDGDLESLHGDPKFEKVVRDRFGPK